MLLRRKKQTTLLDCKQHFMMVNSLVTVLLTALTFLFSITLSTAQQLAAPVQTNKGWGYVKPDGTWLITPSFSRFWFDSKVVAGDDDAFNVLCEFHNGMARMRKGGRWGYINNEGIEIIKVHYNATYEFNDSVAAVQWSGSWGFIDKQGAYIFKNTYPEVQSFYNGIAAVKEHGDWGYINKQGEWIIKPQYKEVKRFAESLAAVSIKGKWGYIDINNNLKIQAQYIEAYNFKDGLARVLTKTGWGFINASGAFVTQSEFEKLMPFANNMARVKNGKMWTYINRKGKLIGVQFINAEDFSDNAAKVRIDSGWGFIDTTGNWLLPPIYEAVGDFVNGFARVRTGRLSGSLQPINWKFINKKGQHVFEDLLFEKAEDFANGFARIRLNDRWGFINLKGDLIIKPQFEVSFDFETIE